MASSVMHSVTVSLALLVMIAMLHIFRSDVSAHDTEASIKSAEIPNLLSGLTSTDAMVRADAVHHLGLIAEVEDVNRVLPRIGEALKDPAPAVRYEAVRALGHYTHLTTDFMPAIIEAVKDPDAKVRRFACRSLGSFAARGKPAVPALEEALRDADFHVRHRAADALLRINGLNASPEVVCVLIHALNEEIIKEDDENDRFNPGSALAMVTGEGGKQCVASQKDKVMSSAIHALDDLREEYRSAGAKVIAWIGSDAKSALPRLITLLGDEDRSVRRYSADAVASMGHDGVAASAALVKILGEDDGELKSASAFALGSIGASDDAAISALRNALNDQQPFVRYYAAAALGRIGPAAKSALPDLQALLAKEDQSDPNRVRAATSFALERIQGKP